MPNWNPSFPEVLGNEWLANVGQTGRVWAGAPAVMARHQSTVAETITSLKLSATLNPLLTASVPTVVDIIEAGNETTPLFQAAELIPNSDVTINGWRTETGGSTNLYQSIDENAVQWPGPAQKTWIQNTNPDQTYVPTFNASAFSTGALQNARIGFVQARAIFGANTGYRKLRVRMQIGSDIFLPAGGDLRDVNAYGATYFFQWGELNPATGKPWVPADIAQFDVGGTSKLYVQSYSATASQFPKVYALRLWVWYVTTDNRVAVAVWRRPDTVTTGVSNITTDSLVTVPSGAAGWSKLSGRNYLFYWRQSVSPSLYGAVVADDVRWNLMRQNLGPAGQPAGYAPPPGGILGAHGIAHDQFGRPAEGFAADAFGSAMGLAMVRSDAATSVDSQPYRLTVADLVAVTSTQSVGQRVTPGANATYLGVRLVIAPPATGDPTLTVKVRRVSDSVQIGGTFTVTASTVRALPAGIAGWRYVTGFLSSAAALVSGTAYEIQVSTSSGGSWTVPMPDCSLGNTASFGGSTNGGFIGSTHFADRELTVNLVRQPDPPTGVSAQINNTNVTSFAGDATTWQTVLLTWTLPAVGMGGLFARYEIERQLAGGAWLRVANIKTSSINIWADLEVPRGVLTAYRIRAVGTDGRFSAWATSGNITLTDTRPMLILTSNHAATQTFVHLYELTDTADAETVYPVLSTEHDEYVAIHGTDYQIVFMEAEDRGIGWRTRASLKAASLTGAKGLARFDALLDLVRSMTIPYVCAMDHQGTRILGHVRASEGIQAQPDYQYTVQLEITPTHVNDVAAEVT